MTFRIGYRVPDGVVVETELQHLAVFGLTRKSGKTTALEAFAQRVGATTLTFRTKRGDLGFAGARRIQPYFREHVDWRFIEGLISAQLQERAQWYRGDIILACRGARSVSEVHANVRKRLEKTKNQWTEKALVELDQYLTEIEESIRTHAFATSVEFVPGRAVLMDIEEYPPAMQQLVIASTLTHILDHEHRVIIVLPEARDFIPEDRLTPARIAVDAFVRKGAALENYLWLDSQSLTGLDMRVMRNVGLWLFGRQTLDLEVNRDLKFLPGRRHVPEEITGLGLGQFLVVEGDTVTKTYVQPAWLTDGLGIQVAKGLIPVARAQEVAPKPKEEDVDAKERKGYEDRIGELEKRVKSLDHDLGVAIESARDWKKKAEAEHDRAEANAKLAADRQVDAVTASAAALNAAVDRANREGHGDLLEKSSPERIDLHVDRLAPNLTVHEKLVHVEATGEDLKGRIALLIAEGFFDQERTQGGVAWEARSRGWGRFDSGTQFNRLRDQLAEFCEWGFFRLEGKQYTLTPEAKERVRVVKEKVAA